jgi:hypothetical protein
VWASLARCSLRGAGVELASLLSWAIWVLRLRSIGSTGLKLNLIHGSSLGGFTPNYLSKVVSPIELIYLSCVPCAALGSSSRWRLQRLLVLIPRCSLASASPRASSQIARDNNPLSHRASSTLARATTIHSLIPRLNRFRCPKLRSWRLVHQLGRQ